MCSGGKGSISHGLGSQGTTTNTYLNNLEFNNKKIKKLGLSIGVSSFRTYLKEAEKGLLGLYD